MERIESIFADYFSHWEISLPPNALSERRGGRIQSRGWSIQYQFGSNEHERFLDFYASHRMTNDRHVRIYETGRTEGLPAYHDMIMYPPNATQEEKDRAEHDYRQHNAAVSEELRRKGFRYN